MSLETKVMSGVSSVVDFMKNQIAATLAEANSKKIIQLDTVTLQKINNLIEASMQSSFVKSSDEIINVIRQEK